MFVVGKKRFIGGGGMVEEMVTMDGDIGVGR